MYFREYVNNKQGGTMESDKRRRLFVTIQVDCEASQAAIDDIDLGTRAVLGIAGICEREGLRATFAVIPTDVTGAPGLYRRMLSAGHEVALHTHPKEEGWEEYLGIYGHEEQVEIIGTAAGKLADELGDAPRGFTPGYFSANDHTYPTLVELGFTHGTVSLPTRNLPQCACVWGNSPSWAHYAHRNNRCLSGDLDFVDIPPTFDPESRLWGGATPQDLRVELVDAKNHYYTVEKAVRSQLATGSPSALPYIKVLTHNIFEYSDPADFRRATLLGIIRAIREIADRNSLEIVPATTAEIAAAYRSAVPLPASAPLLTPERRGWDVARSPAAEAGEERKGSLSG
jgi:peptidoglycan/xylan/chitin deacetylase (PgdA/CDA1 family)